MERPQRLWDVVPVSERCLLGCSIRGLAPPPLCVFGKPAVVLIPAFEGVWTGVIQAVWFFFFRSLFPFQCESLVLVIFLFVPPITQPMHGLISLSSQPVRRWSGC